MNEQRGSDGWVSPGGTPVAPEPLTGSDPAPAAEAAAKAANMKLLHAAYAKAV